MRQVCETCGQGYNDEIHSTVCPHNGIGFCRRCDCVVCICPKPEPEKPLLMRVIYCRPTDFPDGFVVREWEITDKATPGRLIGAAFSLEYAREMARFPGAVRLERDPKDETQIVESWI